MSNNMLLEDQLFRRMSTVETCLTTNQKGQVVIKSGTRPDWLLPLLKHTHAGGLPDAFVMHCVRAVAYSFYNVGIGRLDPPVADMVDMSGIYSSTIEEAAVDYAHDLMNDGSSKRRWLMWRDGAHWAYLDEAIRSVNVMDFDDVLKGGMELQCHEVGDRMVDFFDDLAAVEVETEGLNEEGVETPDQSKVFSPDDCKSCAGCMKTVSAREWATCRHHACPAAWENMSVRSTYTTD